MTIDRMDQQAGTSNWRAEQMPTVEFASLPLARAYIDSFRERTGLFDARELIDAIARLDRAYNDFPELAVDRPRGELLAGLRSAAQDMPDETAIPLLMFCVELNPSYSSSVTSLLERIARSASLPSLAPVLRMLCRARELRWHAIKPMVELLRQQGRAETALKVISEVLDSVKFSKDESAADLGNVLIDVLSDEHPIGINSRALAEVARSARRRLSRLPPRRNEERSRAALLLMAERLAAILSPARLDHPPDLAWPSGRMSFGEFVLQWPCEVELPTGLDDAMFVEEAHRSILLRVPDAATIDRYKRLLRDGAVSKRQIIEELLASEEFRYLGRRVRVNYGGDIITPPERSFGNARAPAVTWPWMSVS